MTSARRVRLAIRMRIKFDVETEEEEEFFDDLKERR